jgi:hypothetical protein
LKKLLILGCSKLKRLDSGPALDIYDGPAFRLLRKRKPLLTCDIDVLIVSARYGLISATEPIERYDETLSTKRAQSLAPRVQEQVRVLVSGPYDSALIAAPSAYVNLLPLGTLRQESATLAVCSNSQGRSLAFLLEWLGFKAVSDPRSRSSIGPFKAMRDSLSKDNLVALAAEANELTSRRAAFRPSWFVTIGSITVPVKSLVTLWTGVPASDFETLHALTLLRHFGFTPQVRSPQ